MPIVPAANCDRPQFNKPPAARQSAPQTEAKMSFRTGPQCQVGRMHHEIEYEMRETATAIAAATVPPRRRKAAPNRTDHTTDMTSE